MLYRKMGHFWRNFVLMKECRDKFFSAQNDCATTI